MVGGSAFAVVSERSADRVLFPRSGLVGDAVDTTTWPRHLLAEWTRRG